MICPNAPPPPVTSIMIPADIIPFSMEARISLRLIFLPRMKIAVNNPIPTATIGCPRKIRIWKNPSVNFIAVNTVFIKIKMTGKTMGRKEENVEGRFSEPNSMDFPDSTLPACASTSSSFSLTIQFNFLAIYFLA